MQARHALPLLLPVLLGLQLQLSHQVLGLDLPAPRGMIYKGESFTLAWCCGPSQRASWLRVSPSTPRVDTCLQRSPQGLNLKPLRPKCIPTPGSEAALLGEPSSAGARNASQEQRLGADLDRTTHTAVSPRSGGLQLGCK